MSCQALQHLLPVRGQRNEDSAADGSIAAPFDETALDETIHELHNRVMADLEPVRQHPDGGVGATLKALDLKQQQVLLRLDARRPGRVFADPHEPP